MGILRPLGNSNITDENGKNFIGTLRYSSPEFLLRKEEESLCGYRALTFYQLGAVLHDLIMKRPLFEDFTTPYGILVNAVQHEQPYIERTDINPNLILLAERCLVKKADDRLKLVGWDDFENIELQGDFNHKELVKQGSSIIDSPQSRNSLNYQENVLKNEIINSLETLIRKECTGQTFLPPITIKKKSTNSNSISVTFDKCPQKNLVCHLKLFFCYEIVDLSTKSILVDMDAGLFLEGDVVSVNEKDIKIIYKGKLDSPSFHKKISESIWKYYHLAQRASKTLEMSVDNGVYWINKL